MTPVDIARSLFDSIDAAGAAAGDGSFDRSALDAVRDAGIYGASVPRAVGGLELPLAEAVDVWAEIARADGSIGWCLFASDVALAYFGAYLPDAGADEVFGEGLPLMGGQFAPNGTAEHREAGWVVDGDYQFGSGITLASWAGAGFFATPPDGGDPAFLFGCFPADQIEPRGNWHVMGLRATQSIDYGVRGLTIPETRVFDFFAPVVHRGSPMHHLGVLPITAAGHAGWALGVTRRMLDELADLAPGRVRMAASSSLAESEHFLVSYGRLEARYEASRAWVREVCSAAEAEAADLGGPPTAATSNRLRAACVHANRDGADIAREAYLLAGTSALRDGILQRCFRDLHAGVQHFFASNAATIDWSRSLLESRGPDE